MRLSEAVDVAVVIILEGLEQHDAARVLVAEERYRVIHALLQVAEADDIAEGLYAVQYAVRAAERLYQSVHLEVFVHPQSVERRRVKARQEHIDDDKETQLLVLHAERNVLIVTLEPVAVGRIVRLEHLVIIADRHIEEISRGLVERGGILRILLPQQAVLFGLLLIGGIAVDRGYPQRLCGICRHLALELLIIELCHRHGCHAEYGIEAADALLLLDLLHLAAVGGSDLLYVRERVEGIGLAAAVGLLIKMVEYVLRHELDAFRSHERLLAVDIPNLFIVDIRLGLHSADIVHSERQHVFIIDGVDDRVGMELIAEGLLGSEELRILHRPCI